MTEEAPATAMEQESTPASVAASEDDADRNDEPSAKKIKLHGEPSTEDHAQTEDRAEAKSEVTTEAVAEAKSVESPEPAAENGGDAENADKEENGDDNGAEEGVKNVENGGKDDVNGEEEKENDSDKVKNGSKENGGKAEADPNKRKSAAEKCLECDYKCWTDAEMKIHCQTSHNGPRTRKLMCSNCNFSCTNTWEMDYHARSRGHKAKEVFTCKKCDVLLDSKEDLQNHRKVHIPEDKLVECADCSWVGDRLDNMRYHIYSQDHKPKMDYEEKARTRAEAGGPKALKHYQTKLAKDIKKAQGAKK